MRLGEYSLHQFDEANRDSLGGAALRALSVRLLEDLKEAQDRLNLGPDNSSQQLSRQPPRGDGRVASSC